MNDLPTLTNETLIARLEHLAQSERKLQVEVLRLLAELDERKVVVQMGYSGLWDFSRRRLKFSEATATRRVNVARAARRFPEILTMLEDGRLNLGSAAELVPGLNEANAQEPRALGEALSRARFWACSPFIALQKHCHERDLGSLPSLLPQQQTCRDIDLKVDF